MVILFIGFGIIFLLLLGTILENCVQKAEVLMMACQAEAGSSDFLEIRKIAI